MFYNINSYLILPLGNHMLGLLKDKGVLTMVRGAVTGVKVEGGGVTGIDVISSTSSSTSSTSSSTSSTSSTSSSHLCHISTSTFINATGPFLRSVHALLPPHLEKPLPVFNQLHAKVIIVFYFMNLFFIF